MTFTEYQNACLRTWNDTIANFHQVLNAALGVVGEAGEYADSVKKWAFHGHCALDVDELGDILYYLSISASLLGISLEDLAERNIEKLTDRYPKGFDPERSRNR